eukprot:jgi/Mesvir1/12459/Mv00613-RA.1
MSSAKSKYTLYVSNISSLTRTKDLDYEFGRFGSIRDLEVDRDLRAALIMFKRADDASYAWRKMDNYSMDGRRWIVDYANKRDFKDFGWKWTEAEDSPSRSRSRSRSPTRSPSRSPSRSPA